MSWTHVKFETSVVRCQGRKRWEDGTTERHDGRRLGPPSRPVVYVLLPLTTRVD